MIVKKNVILPMRDGVELAADLYMPGHPGGGGSYPAIIEFTPYHKDDLQKASGAEAMLTSFARRGYIGVELDVRGTGSSAGTAPSGLSHQDALDGYDAVEWIAKQPFCNGKVGMTGVSYGGWTSYMTAIQHPPHLTAIAPANITDDLYLANYPGGGQGGYLFVLYDAYMLAYNSQPPTYVDDEDRWSRVWKEHLSGIAPWLHPWIANPTPDARVWRENSFRGRYEEIKTPTFIIDGWHDIYPIVTRIFAGIRAPKKMLIGPWSHMLPDVSVPGPRIDYAHELLRWFDYWLKGVDSGVMSEPPISIYVQRAWDPAKSSDIPGKWRFENEWPIKRTEEMTLYLREDGSLKREPNQAKDGDASAADAYAYDPTVGVTSAAKWFSGFGLNVLTAQDQRPDDAHSLSFTSDALEEELEVTGNCRVVLHFSSSAPVISAVAKLCDVTPSGPSILVSTGRLNATQRNADENPKSLKPRRAYKVEIKIEPTAYVFGKDHRVRLSISNSDFPCVWPTPTRAECTIYHSAARPSRIVLPTIPRRSASIASPRFRPPPQGMMPPSDDDPIVRWTTTRDELKNVVTVELGYRGTLKVDAEDSMTYEGAVLSCVGADNPASVRMDAMQRVEISSQRMGDYKISATSSVESDETSFGLLETVSIVKDGRPLFEKKWSKKTPRKYR